MTPIYAIAPRGAFAREVYQGLANALAHQVAAGSSDVLPADVVEHVSVPGFITGEKVKLISGQILPVIELRNMRALYTWNIDVLVQHVLDALRARNPTVNSRPFRGR